MQCFRRCALAIALAAAAGASACAVALYFAAGWLNAADPLAPADAIIVLGGDASRALEAAELYRAGYGKRVYLFSPARARTELLLDQAGVNMPREEQLARAALVARGVPDESIRLFSQTVASTVEEAELVGRTLAAEERLLVVSSAFHLRRVRMVYRQVLPQRQVRFAANRYDPFPEAWWRDREASKHLILETSKIVFYLLGGRFQSAS